MTVMICGYKTPDGKTMECRKRQNGEYYDCMDCWVYHQIERHGKKFEDLAKEFKFPLNF